MDDYFSILGLPRRPWLDPAEIQARFLERSAQVHPDKSALETANAQFALLNTAQSTLKEPRARLLHLLALEGLETGAHVQTVPAPILDLFPTVADLLRRSDRFLADKSKNTSPMLRAQFFAAGLDWTDQLQSLLALIQQKIDSLCQQIRAADQRWSTSDRPLLLRELEELSRSLGFLEKWRAQLRERIHALAF